MSSKCRLKPLGLPDEVFDRYALRPLHNSDVIEVKVYKESQPFSRFKNLGVYSLEKVFSDRDLSVGSEIYVELCCGTGDFLTSAAADLTDVTFVGVDYAAPVIERAVVKALEKKLNNVVFYNGRVDDFLVYDFKDIEADILMVNFPDPWPKKKHFKRKIIRPDFVPYVVSAVKPGGYLTTATDVRNVYEEHMRFLNECPELENLPLEPGDYPLDAYQTVSSYQKKGIETGRSIYYTKHKKVMRD